MRLAWAGSFLRGSFAGKYRKNKDSTSYHRSSEEARFWAYERGSREQHRAREHWDGSLLEQFSE